MIKKTKERAKATYYRAGVFMTLGMMGLSNTASATGNTDPNGRDFSDIAGNITKATSEIPGMISGISYLIGSLLAVLGIMKIKDHVENPTQTPLKEGAIRLTAGGALFALPIIMESMATSVGITDSPPAASKLHKVTFDTL